MSSDFNYSEVELEHDFCLAMNMMLGESYEKAQISAKEWMAEAREDFPSENENSNVPNLQRIRNDRSRKASNSSED